MSSLFFTALGNSEFTINSWPKEEHIKQMPELGITLIVTVEKSGDMLNEIAC